MRDYNEILESPGFSVEKIREDFDYLNMPGDQIIYLDNAATTQRPRPVIERVAKFMANENANPLRGNHRLSLLATEAYENSRRRIQEFIHAARAEEIIFTRNATESLNLVAYSWGLNNLKQGDEILITRMEHHSNSVNWQFVSQKTGASLKYVGLTEDYQLDMDDFRQQLSEKTRVVAFTGASNVLSAMPNIKEIIRLAKERGALTVLDAAQLIPHEKVDVQDLDCDFMAFSGHKMCAPFGIGVLYGKKKLLESIPPFLYGGEMIEYVYDEESTFAELPYKFEAGTQNVGGAVGLHAAIDYLEAIGMDKIAEYEKALAQYCYLRLQEIPNLDIYHPSSGERGVAVAFNFKDIHPHDVSTILDNESIAIRSGHHCTQQLHRYLDVNATCRASFAFYNTKEEVDRLIEGLKVVRQTMGL